MVRKVVCSVIALVLCVGITLAEEYRGMITKVDGNKVTFVTIKFNKEAKKVEKGPEQTLPVADNAKVLKGTFNKDTKKLENLEPLTGGLKNEIFTKGGEKGVGATIVTDADNKKITEIRVGSGFGKGKGKGKTNN